MRHSTILLLVLASLLFAGYLTVTPVGEAPDEAAHILYLGYLLRNGELPPLPSADEPSTYEAHQPPLSYLITAGLLRALGVESLDYPFVSNPELDFFAPGSRAYLEPEDSTLAMHEGFKVRLARWSNLLWLLATVWALLKAARLSSGGPAGLAVASAFALAPQFLFISSSINNDAAVTAFSSLAFLNLLTMAGEGSEDSSSNRSAFLAGLLAGLALWSKISALFLLAPAALATLSLIRRRALKPLLAFWLPLLLLSLFWLAANWMRFGAFLPPPPTGFSAQPEVGIVRLLTEPGWIASLGGSFWAKFGWLNTPLPLPLYAAFLPASLLVLWGAVQGLFRKDGNPNPAVRLALAGLAANLAMLLGYLVFIDWQPQGRYLFPCLVPITVLASTGLQDVISRLARLLTLNRPLFGWGSLCFFALIALAGIFRIATSFG